jgi:peptidoglycan/xylan/chitin deacetylase (PgdA/CDA1 family)
MRLLRAAAIRAARTPPARASVWLLDALAASPGDTFAVLTYHRVAEQRDRHSLYPALLSATPSGFEDQMKLLVRRYRPVSLADVLAACGGGQRLPARSVMVTFDDAYRDFQQNAWPTLRKFGIPATLFVPTGFPGLPEHALWWDRLWAAIAHAPGNIRLETPMGLVSLGPREGRIPLATRLIQHHKLVPHAEAMASVDRICELIGPHRSGNEVLGWDELRTLSRQGVSLAPHSRSHPLLTKVPDSVLRDEVEGSRADLAAEVPESESASAFAYPAGAYDKRVLGAVRQLGFQIGFTTDWGINRIGSTEPLRLRRINVGPQSDAGLIKAQLVIGAFGQRLLRL